MVLPFGSVKLLSFHGRAGKLALCSSLGNLAGSQLLWNSLTTGEHAFKLGGSRFNYTQQDVAHSPVLIGTKLSLPTLGQAQPHPTHAAALSQLKLSQVSHPSQFFEVHRVESSLK